MKSTISIWAGVILIVASATAVADMTLLVSDPDGAAASARAPVSASVNLKQRFPSNVPPARLRLIERTPNGDAAGPVAVQFEADKAGSPRGTLWWLMPPGPKGSRRFRLTIADQTAPTSPAMRIDRTGQYYDVAQGSQPVLRYNHGSVPVPEGTRKHFIEGESYQRGDYIHPLYGPAGEVLTDDYPRDHPHHRGVWWSWPLTRWGDQIGDIWAVVRVHARPVGMRSAGGDVMAVLQADNLWKWADGTAIVREEVTIRVFRQTDGNRYVDVDLRLTGLADDVAIGGRPGKGYGGFSIRNAAGEEQKIEVHGDPAATTPQRAWVDYSSVLPGSSGRTGIALFEHPSNPDYPSELQVYADLNCIMAAFPGNREVLLPKDQTLKLRQRMWVHCGSADSKLLGNVWAAYASPPQVTVAAE